MLQTILIPRKSFTLPEAVVWLKDNHYPHHKIDITGNYYRFRQHDPIEHSKYYTHTLKNGVELVHSYE
jgi:hypothetical protein